MFQVVPVFCRSLSLLLCLLLMPVRPWLMSMLSSLLYPDLMSTDPACPSTVPTQHFRGHGGSHQFCGCQSFVVVPYRILVIFEYLTRPREAVWSISAWMAVDYCPDPVLVSSFVLSPKSQSTVTDFAAQHPHDCSHCKFVLCYLPQN